MEESLIWIFDLVGARRRAMGAGALVLDGGTKEYNGVCTGCHLGNLRDGRVYGHVGFLHWGL